MNKKYVWNTPEPVTLVASRDLGGRRSFVPGRLTLIKCTLHYLSFIPSICDTVPIQNIFKDGIPVYTMPSLPFLSSPPPLS
jgi:hypothetical protein